jgi:hypothetical protein
MASNCDIEKALLDMAIEALKQVEQSEKAHCWRANSLAEELEKARQRIAELEGILLEAEGIAPDGELRPTVPKLAEMVAERDRRITELEADAERLKQRYKWRPIEEAHEDFGECIYIDINDPGNTCMAHVLIRDYEDTVEGMTHFAQAPELTNEMADELIAAQRQKEGE